MAKKAAVSSILMMLLVLFDVTMAAQVYRVGDYAGWNHKNKVNYSEWAASNFFQVGDVLVFQFDPSNDNVFRVSAEEFDACRGPSPFGLPSDGTEIYPLDSPGPWYFICSIPGRCDAGQKLKIIVHPVASPPPQTNRPQPPASAPSKANQPAMAPSQSTQPQPSVPTPSHSSQTQPSAPAPSQTNQPQPQAPTPSQANQPSSSSPAASPSNSPADEKSGSAAFSVNFWVATVAVAFSVCCIARSNY